MSNSAVVKSADVSRTGTSVLTKHSEKEISIRVAPNSYFIALFTTTFFSGLLIYLERDLTGILLFVLSWLIFSILAWTDRITFNGKKLIRTGLLPRFWATLNNSRYKLNVNDIEQVETQALRALKRGGNVFYRYHTSVKGKNLKFDFASGGEEYRQMIHRLFSSLSENILDNRSIELRDFLREPKETLMKAEFAKIPSVDVLESSLNQYRKGNKSLQTKHNPQNAGYEEMEKADYLHQLGNELRLSGYLIQALEAFRRALALNPKDARLLFDFARCLHSFAGSERDKNLARKSLAALRLAEKRGKNDGEMLAQLGESYFQYGNWKRARGAFQKSLDAAENSFRSVKGLAEIALREGKIAHVIHQFSTANRLAENSSLRRWTQSESDYFSRLNSDDDYMEMEVSRVNLLESVENAKKTFLKIAMLGFPIIVFGVTLEDILIANIGWAISTVAILVWVGTIFSRNLLSSRIPMDLTDED